MLPSPFLLLRSHSSSSNFGSSTSRKSYANHQSPQLGLEIHEVGLVWVDILQGLIAKLFLELQTSIWTPINILPDLLVVMLALLHQCHYIVPLDDIVDPISQVHNIEGEWWVLADIDKLRSLLKLHQALKVLLWNFLEVYISQTSDEVLSIFVKQSQFLESRPVELLDRLVVKHMV